jgi:hypothetical protein
MRTVTMILNLILSIKKVNNRWIFQISNQKYLPKNRLVKYV